MVVGDPSVSRTVRTAQQHVGRLGARGSGDLDPVAREDARFEIDDARLDARAADVHADRAFRLRSHALSLSSAA